MPTYDYECQACGHAFERFQEMSARKLRTCPECRKKKLIRLVGAGAGVIFKGSGFYETDYKRAGTSKPTQNGKTGESAKDASSSSESASSESASSKAASSQADAPKTKKADTKQGSSPKNSSGSKRK